MGYLNLVEVGIFDLDGEAKQAGLQITLDLIDVTGFQTGCPDKTPIIISHCDLGSSPHVIEAAKAIALVTHRRSSL